MADKVVFRKWEDDDYGVIALFPRIAASTNGYLCQSYGHIGQHGGADPHIVASRTCPAKPQEYAELAKELRQRGYKLKIMKRCTYKDFEIRKKQIERIYEE